MSSVWGNSLKLSLFGEGRGAVVGGTLDGFPAGVKVDLDRIKRGLKLRQGTINFNSARREEERPNIVSGVTAGVTNGAPITVLFRNKDVNVPDHDKDVPRPSHADYVAEIRYGGYADTNGGGHLSGRLTLPIVFFGMMIADYLEERGIYIASHIKCIGEIYDEKFPEDPSVELIDRLNSAPLAVINPEARKKMVSLLTSLYATGDSIGGAIESVVAGLPAGYGSPRFNSLESSMASILFSIPAVKSVSFGFGAKFAHARGSEVADGFEYEDGTVKTNHNFNGGLNGGISNGMPVKVTTVFKPTPSIAQPLKTLNIKTNDIVDLELKGRHVPSLAPRAAVVCTSAIAVAVMDAYLEGNGYRNGL